MKLKIPHEFQLGAHTFKIVWSPKLLNAAGAKGQAEYLEKHIIRLRPGRPSSHTFNSLLHETIHLIDFIYGPDDDILEGTTRFLAGGLCQALMSLGIEPDFSDIPEEEL